MEEPTSPGWSCGSRLYMATDLPRMTRKRRWQYSWPMEFTPRWYTHPEYSAALRSLPPLPLPLLRLPRSGDPASESSTSEISPAAADGGAVGGLTAVAISRGVRGGGFRR